MKYSSLIVSLCFMFSACTQTRQQNAAEKGPVNSDSMKNILIQTDAAFSQLSSEKGTHAAFMQYAAGEATLLRPSHMPIVGKDSIHDYLYSRSDSAYTLTWKPLTADISASGDLGYTYGTYHFAMKHSNESEEGTYLSVWKKDAEGNYKYVVDTGNPGLNPAKQLTN